MLCHAAADADALPPLRCRRFSPYDSHYATIFAATLLLRLSLRLFAITPRRQRHYAARYYVTGTLLITRLPPRYADTLRANNAQYYRHVFYSDATPLLLFFIYITFFISLFYYAIDYFRR